MSILKFISVTYFKTKDSSGGRVICKETTGFFFSSWRFYWFTLCLPPIRLAKKGGMIFWHSLRTYQHQLKNEPVVQTEKLIYLVIYLKSAIVRVTWKFSENFAREKIWRFIIFWYLFSVRPLNSKELKSGGTSVVDFPGNGQILVSTL